MPERALMMLAVSAALLLLWEYMSLKRNHQLPLWLGAFLVLTSVMCRVSAGWLGMLGAIYLLWPDHTYTYRMMAGGLGFIAGMWVMAVVMQVLSNLLRHQMGYPQRKLEWIRPMGRRKKR